MNEPKQIQAIPAIIGGAPAEHHLGFFNRVKSHVLTYVVDKLDERSTRIQTVFNDFIEAYADEDTLWKKEQGSEYTPLILETDEKRDQLVSGIYAGLKYYHYVGSESQKRAADKLLSKWTLFKISMKDQYEEEVDKVKQFVESLEQEADLILSVTTLGMSDHMARLKAYNLACMSLINQRNAERAQFETGAMENARRTTEAAYRAVAQTINSFAAVTFDGTSGPYDEAIDMINTDIEYYKKFLKAKEAEAAQEKAAAKVEMSSEENEETGEAEA